jgi:hypothetical protein
MKAPKKLWSTGEFQKLLELTDKRDCVKKPPHSHPAIWHSPRWCNSAITDNVVFEVDKDTVMGKQQDPSHCATVIIDLNNVHLVTVSYELYVSDSFISTPLRLRVLHDFPNLGSLHTLPLLPTLWVPFVVRPLPSPKLYTALSQVRKREDSAVLLPEGDTMETRNVIHRCLLL